ncbi:MAG: lysylphosphatidylglycerol synthase transmembrane domain-containing protein [Clostridium celatum]|nr:lysylphosphatidylglycerol synthase transmembrane domain-containing protein [Clostridium celatum]
MSNNITPKDIFKNSIFFIALISVTFFILFKDSSVSNILISLKSVNLFYIFIGIICMFIFIICEGINIRRMLKIFSYDISVFQGLKYSFVGFFFSSITPSASGGQPMQVYYMKRDNINISHSSLVLLMELASFQIVTVTIAVIGIIANLDFIMNLNYTMRILIFLGLLINLLILCFIILAIFSKKFTMKLAELFLRLISILKFIDVEKIRKQVKEQISQYQQGAILIIENKYIFIKVLLITIIQIGAMYSITFFVYKAFGLDDLSFFTVFLIQAILFISVSAIPLPGAVGTSEGSFLTLFKTLFPSSSLSSAMLLSRGISFYLFVIISGIVVASIRLLKSKSSIKCSKGSLTNEKII